MLTIKLIEVLGSYKAMVLDMSRNENRLVHLVEHSDKDLCYNLALDYVETFEGSQRLGVQWH